MRRFLVCVMLTLWAVDAADVSWPGMYDLPFQLHVTLVYHTDFTPDAHNWGTRVLDDLSKELDRSNISYTYATISSVNSTCNQYVVGDSGHIFNSIQWSSPSSTSSSATGLDYVLRESVRPLEDRDHVHIVLLIDASLNNLMYEGTGFPLCDIEHQSVPSYRDMYGDNQIAIYVIGYNVPDKAVTGFEGCLDDANSTLELWIKTASNDRDDSVACHIPSLMKFARERHQHYFPGPTLPTAPAWPGKYKLPFELHVTLVYHTNFSPVGNNWGQTLREQISEELDRYNPTYTYGVVYSVNSSCNTYLLGNSGEIFTNIPKHAISRTADFTTGLKYILRESVRPLEDDKHIHMVMVIDAALDTVHTHAAPMPLCDDSDDCPLPLYKDTYGDVDIDVEVYSYGAEHEDNWFLPIDDDNSSVFIRIHVNQRPDSFSATRGMVDAFIHRARDRHDVRFQTKDADAAAKAAASSGRLESL